MLATVIALALGLCVQASEPAVLAVTTRPYAPGQRFEISSLADVKLSAEVGAGILSRTVNYDLREEERLTVDVDGPDEQGRSQRRISYAVRQATTTAPLVGRQTKDRRVAGLSYSLVADDAGVQVRNADGSSTREKEARYVRATWMTLGDAPAFHLLLGSSGSAELTEGQVLTADGLLARHLLGLPLEELSTDAVTLTVRGFDGEVGLTLDVSASLSGSAEIAGRDLSLTGTLTGPMLVNRFTGQLIRSELNGSVSIVADADDDSLLSAQGTGSLSLKRQEREVQE